MKQYQLGIYEKAMPSGLSWLERLLAAKEAGFDFVEISIDETDARQARLNWSKEERQSLLNACITVGMPIRTMCLSGHRKYPLGSHDAAVRMYSLEMMEKAINLACDLGIRIIQLAGYDVYYEESDEETRAWFLENLTKCAEMAAAAGVQLGFETMETEFMDTISKAMHYVYATNSPYLDVYPDLGNLTNAAYLYGLNLEDEFEAGKGHICAMHIQETEEGKYRDMRFGEGRVDFASGVGYAIGQGVRCFVAECWDDGRADWKGGLREVNDFVRKYLG